MDFQEEAALFVRQVLFSLWLPRILEYLNHDLESQKEALIITEVVIKAISFQGREIIIGWRYLANNNKWEMFFPKEERLLDIDSRVPEEAIEALKDIFNLHLLKVKIEELTK